VDGDFLFCKSDLCPSKLTGSIKVWIERLGILHWGEALIRSITNPDDPFVSSVADLYRMSVVDLERHCSGQKMAAKCWESLHKDTSIPLEVVLSALNIPNFGLATATDIVKAGYDTVERVLGASASDFEKVPNIGAVTAKRIVEGLEWKKSELRDLADVLDIVSSQHGPLSGMKVCITGDVWAPRRAVQKMIVDAGGQAVGSVAKDTSILVCNDPGSSSGKSKKATKYGIPVISGDALRDVLEGRSSIQDVIASLV
jgi:DNA ligase (NAD+)